MARQKININKIVSEAIGRVQELQAEMGTLADELRSVAEALQEKYDNKSEKWQESDAGEEALDHINNVEAAATAADEGNLDALLEALEEIG